MVSMCSIPTIMIVTILGLVLLQQYQHVNAFSGTSSNVYNVRSSSISLTLPSSLCIQKKQQRQQCYQSTICSNGYINKPGQRNVFQLYCNNVNKCRQHQHDNAIKTDAVFSDKRIDQNAVSMKPASKMKQIVSIIMKFISSRIINTINTSESKIDPNQIILTAGSSGLSVRNVIKNAKKLHDPITYFIMLLLCGFKWEWCFKSPVYWFIVGFTIKWYRARYVYKTPVWDRQPNWNNIITSKEQEKDLKAYTCKNCGSTLFIAKTREFFFEGNTGFGGLGCFTCGAKGAENFIMDRDRIIDDVGDMDDYFEYERPLDFVSRAERRKLLKQSGGDIDKANQLLLEQQTTTTTAPEATTAADTTIDITTVDKDIEKVDANGDYVHQSVDDITSSSSLSSEEVGDSPIKKKKKKKKDKKETILSPPKSDSSASVDDAGLDALDMDSF